MIERMEDVARWVGERYGTASSITPITGDASARDFYRIEHGGDSLVVMDSSRTPLWPWLDIHGLLMGLDFPLPRIILSDESRGFVIQEDLGTTRLCDVEDQESYDAYLDESLGLLRRLQREISPEIASSSISGRRYFTPSFFMAELEHTLEHLFFRLLRVPVEDLFELQGHFRELCERAMGSGTTTFTHRDYHSANLMIHKGKVHIIDWQDARQGPPCYDLASLLRDSYRDCGDGWKGLVSSYILGVGGANMFEFVFSALQRNMKAIGTFAYQYRVLGNDKYLKYIPQTLLYFEGYSKVCPAVKPIVDIFINLIETHTGEIDLRNFRDSDSPVRINL
ncbi:MAG: phosphotransferase [Candidatus Sabulitectum sp.]|nr:phosphotransferase [Candidatus Sabulitectum sp.]